MSTIFVGTTSLPEDPNNLTIDVAMETIGIDKIRDVLAFVSLGKGKSVLLKHAANLTEEAQNALLKTLEEPPLGTTIILEVKDEDLLLPTIRSRCDVVYGPSEDILPATEIFAKIPTLSLPEKLRLAKDESTSREAAKTLVDQLLVAAAKNIEPKIIRALFQAKKYLRANCNSRLVMENLFLNW